MRSRMISHAEARAIAKTRTSDEKRIPTDDLARSRLVPIESPSAMGSQPRIRTVALQPWFTRIRPAWKRRRSEVPPWGLGCRIGRERPPHCTGRASPGLERTPLLAENAAVEDS
jgi:hypothetical protein